MSTYIDLIKKNRAHSDICVVMRAIDANMVRWCHAANSDLDWKECRSKGYPWLIHLAWRTFAAALHYFGDVTRVHYCQTYVFGGYLRDVIAGVDRTSDIDIAIRLFTNEHTECFAESAEFWNQVIGTYFVSHMKKLGYKNVEFFPVDDKRYDNQYSRFHVNIDDRLRLDLVPTLNRTPGSMFPEFRCNRLAYNEKDGLFIDPRLKQSSFTVADAIEDIRRHRLVDADKPLHMFTNVRANRLMKMQSLGYYSLN